MNAPTHPTEQLHAELPDLDWVTDEGRIARLSQDFLVVQPGSETPARPTNVPTPWCVRAPKTKSARLVSLCARLRVPITPRGSGTGNYGQADSPARRRGARHERL